jgi:3-deoxy-7-phosphoheptulonate synthase
MAAFDVLPSAATPTPVPACEVDLGTEGLNIESYRPLLAPRDLKAVLPLTEQAARTVLESRLAIQEILDDIGPKRLLVIAGPCSIHDPQAAIKYARGLLEISRGVSDVMHVVMRTYFEKPRTTVGWKGLINDPRIDGSFDIASGLYTARQLLLEINSLGLSAATEALDPIVPKYMVDLISWYAIGARTTESQTHREMASGLSAPVGLKNGSGGDIAVAINAMLAMRAPHAFLGIDPAGRICEVTTKGNAYGHIVLRGGSAPNYSPEDVAACKAALAAAGLPQKIMIDCSHANSGKRAERQKVVLAACIDQIEEGEESLMGVMLESNLVAGAQSGAARRACCWTINNRRVRGYPNHRGLFAPSGRSAAGLWLGNGALARAANTGISSNPFHCGEISQSNQRAAAF